MIRHDLLLIADFRSRGRLVREIAGELERYRGAGLGVGLLQCESPTEYKATTWAPSILQQLEPGAIEPVLLGSNISAHLAVVRDASIIDAIADIAGQITVVQAVVVSQTESAEDPEEAEAILACVAEHLRTAPHLMYSGTSTLGSENPGEKGETSTLADRIVAICKQARHSVMETEQQDVPAEPIANPPVRLATSFKRRRLRHDVRNRPRALFITSNGAGMGHLTRMLGIARASAATIEPIFFSMSQGVGSVASADIPYEYVPFTSALRTSPGQWNQYFAERLTAAIEHYSADIVIFDGTWPYAGLVKAIRDERLLKVWVRRGMWKPSVGASSLAKSAVFNLVIEPGDFASEYDAGVTRESGDALAVAPISILEQSELLTREQALTELGLASDPDRRYALVTLGAGNINDVTSVQSNFLECIGAQPGWEAVVTKAPIAADRSRVNVKTVSAFPLARYTKAFDFAVSAAGYNSFTEWIAGCLPTIWVPNLETSTDDQDARARWAADHGVGLRVANDDPSAIAAAVEAMTDDGWREAVSGRLRQLPSADGASEAAALVSAAWWDMSSAKDAAHG